MKMEADVLIVGSGPLWATVARRFAEPSPQVRHTAGGIGPLSVGPRQPLPGDKRLDPDPNGRQSHAHRCRAGRADRRWDRETLIVRPEASAKHSIALQIEPF